MTEDEEKKVQEEDAPVGKEKEEIKSIKRRRGCLQKNRRPKPVTRGTGSEVYISTSDTNPVELEGASTPWLSDSKLNSEKVKEAQRKDPVIGRFIVLKEAANKPDWNDVAA